MICFFYDFLLSFSADDFFYKLEYELFEIFCLITSAMEFKVIVLFFIFKIRHLGEVLKIKLKKK